MRKKIYRTVISIVIICVHIRGLSQVNIKGPVCALPGVSYTYLISGKWDSASTMQVCISGGTIQGAINGCTVKSAPLASVQVVWTGGVNGSLELQSSKGNSTITVTITSVLSGGTIGNMKTQAIGFNSVPAAIQCSSASGGACAPKYVYQWQESFDNTSWSDVKGATNQNYNFSGARKQPGFCRRKVTDVASGAVAYSDIATVDVQPPATGQ